MGLPTVTHIASQFKWVLVQSAPSAAHAFESNALLLLLLLPILCQTCSSSTCIALLPIVALLLLLLISVPHLVLQHLQQPPVLCLISVDVNGVGVVAAQHNTTQQQQQQQVVRLASTHNCFRHLAL
jgi:hypothetical protein